MLHCPVILSQQQENSQSQESRFLRNYNYTLFYIDFFREELVSFTY